MATPKRAAFIMVNMALEGLYAPAPTSQPIANRRNS
jgi:hypothetical protein